VIELAHAAAQAASYAPSIYALPLVFTFAAIAFLGFYVGFRERNSPVKTSFCLMTVAAGIWLVAFAVMYCATDPRAALFWAKAAYLGVPFIPSTIYAFTVGVLRLKHTRRATTMAFLASACFSGFALFSGSVIAGVYRYEWGYYPRYALSSAPYLLFFFGLMAESLRLFLVQRRRPQTEIQRARTQSLIFAFSVAYLASLDFLAKFGFEFYPFGFACILAFIGLAADTVTRYRLIDITPSFAAERILGTMGEALLVLDSENIVRVANDAAFRLFSLSRADVIGNHLSAVSPYFPAKDTPEAARRTGTSHLYEIEHRRVNAPPLALEVSESSILDSLGCVIATVLIVRDLTSIRGAQEALHETETRFRRLYNDVPEAIVVLDEFGRFSSLNTSAERLLGCPQEDLLGKIFVMSDLLPPQSMAPVLKVIRGVMQESEEGPFEVELKRDDGQSLRLEAVPSAVRSGGKVCGVQFILRDRSEEARTRRAVEEARLDLERRVRERLKEIFKNDAEWLGRIEEMRF